MEINGLRANIVQTGDAEHRRWILPQCTFPDAVGDMIVFSLEVQNEDEPPVAMSFKVTMVMDDGAIETFDYVFTGANAGTYVWAEAAGQGGG